MSRRNQILVLLVLLSVITFLDRTCITFASLEIKSDLGISQSGWGWVMSIFTLGYGLLQLPLGALGDRFGHRWVLALIVIWWSAFTCMTGLAGGLAAMLVIRFCFGVGEAGASPCSTSVVGRWFPADRVGRAQGYIWAATRLGGAVAPFLVLPLVAAHGWRLPFYVLGGVGLVWAVVWLCFYREPAVGVKPERSQEEPVGVPWSRMMGSGQFWMLCAMYFFYAFGSWFFFTWFPEYMKQGRGFDAQQLRYVVAIPFLMSMAGNIAGGWLTDHLTARYGIGVGRKALGSVCLAVSALCMVLAAFIPGKVAVFIFLSLCFGIFDLMLPSAWALCIDLGGRCAGAVSGAMNTFGNLGGFCCSLMFGYMLGLTGNYDLPLYVIAAMLLLSALLFAFINPAKRIVQ